MTEASTSELKQAIETQHGGTATFVQSVPVRETHGEETVWNGVVSVFELAGHPRAKTVYAWSYELAGGERRFFAVLHVPPITSPARAVRAAILAEQRDKLDACTACGGTGLVMESRPIRKFLQKPPPATCPTCKGSGSRLMIDN
jgi:hypothetical protein